MNALVKFHVVRSPRADSSSAASTALIAHLLLQPRYTQRPALPPLYSPQTLTHRKTTPVSIQEQQVPLCSCKTSEPGIHFPPEASSDHISGNQRPSRDHHQAPARQAQRLVRPEHDAFAGQQFLFQQSTAPPAVAASPCAPYRLPSTCLHVMTCPPRTRHTTEATHTRKTSAEARKH